MHLYNTTFGVAKSVEKEFVEWLNQEFIPASTGDGQYFHSPELMRVHSTDPDANTLALHLRADSLDDINLWYEDHGSRLFDYIQRRWNGHVVFFCTTLSRM